MNEPRKIFLTGASGFIGGHILRALADRGHQVTCLARGRGARAIEALALPGVRVVEGEFTRPESYLAHVGGHDVVINAVGIIRETAGADFETVHQRAPVALFEEAARTGVGKVVQVSALGADAGARSRYHLTKRAADERLTELGVPHIILRPSIVYGPGDHSMTFFLSLAAAPITAVPGDGAYRVQPIHVDDLVQAVVQAVTRNDLRSAVVDAGGAVAVTFDELLDTLAERLGKPRARKLHLPWWLMRCAAWVTDALGRGPITGEELGMLRRGSTCDVESFAKTFGFTPVPLRVGLARRPLSEADAWHARLAPLRVPLRLSIAFVWLATGIICAFISVAQGYELLGRVGLTGALADVALYGTCALEIVLGVATALGWRVWLMGVIQLVLIVGFTLILTLKLPAFWLDPFGPVTKNIPLIGATLVMMALERGDRG
ncbi:MAG: NAD(P)H-binding protein [Gemmataceae bacterium]|nr:NAD(P)H-binding protein [Gemmataceae bacterium]